MGSGRIPLEDRLWSRVLKGADDDCWLWVGCLSTDGYGKIGEGGASASGSKSLFVHRVVYEMVIGTIPDGYEVDHLCHTKECGKTGKECLHRRCVNPAHLSAVTHRDNSIRDECTASGKNVAKTHCPAGHEYNEENTRYEKNRNGGLSRKCRICDRELHRKIRRAAGVKEVGPNQKAAGMICSVMDCGKPVKSKGFCSSHYDKSRREKQKSNLVNEK